MIIERSPYLSTIAKKSPWQAVPVDKGQVLDGAEETRFVTFVTGGAADLAHLKQQRVVVAIDESVFDFLKIARLLPL